MKKMPKRVERFLQIKHKVVFSNAFRYLDYSARSLYLFMRAMLNGSNNGNISVPLSTARHWGWNSPTTLAKNLRQLEAVGLIAKTRATVGVENGSKLCNLYRFTDEPCFEMPRFGIPAMLATNDYEKLTGPQAEAILAAAAQPRKKKEPSSSGESAPSTVSMASVDGTETGERLVAEV